ncbi:MAG: hypothetical protein ACD_72C00214G0002 [uncultured bacterium]|nr:MAG: hypothetical protein ACD_72C00214G0002 [uncultured bacterium]
MAAQDFGYVGCRNKYHLERDINIHDQNKQVVGKCEYPGTRWRCINTVWSCAGDDQDLARVPTEIQLVTRAMQRVGKFRHPLRTFSRRVDLVGLVGQSQAWLLEDMVEKLTAKVAVYDLKNFLNNKKV